VIEVAVSGIAGGRGDGVYYREDAVIGERYRRGSVSHFGMKPDRIAIVTREPDILIGKMNKITMPQFFEKSFRIAPASGDRARATWEHVHGMKDGVLNHIAALIGQVARMTDDAAVVVFPTIGILAGGSLLGNLACANLLPGGSIRGKRVLVDFVRCSSRGVITGRRRDLQLVGRGVLRARGGAGKQQRQRRGSDDPEFCEIEAGCPHRLSFRVCR
jgi:hypothetical protein